MVRRRNWLGADSATQWWPSMARPEGTANWPQGPTLDSQGRTGTVTSVADTPLTKQKLCAAVADKAVPFVLEVQIQAARGTLDSYVKQSNDYPAKSVEAEDVAGQLIIEYGTGGVVETAVIDLKNGSYQLPPSDQVRVFVTTSIDNVGTSIPVLQISSALTEGNIACPTTPTFTVQHGNLTSAGFATQVPDRARFVDMWLANSGAAIKYGAGAPVLFTTGVAGSDEMLPQLVRDYTTGIFIPPYPAAMFIQNDNIEQGITMDTNVTCEAVLQFILEL